MGGRPQSEMTRYQKRQQILANELEEDALYGDPDFEADYLAKHDKAWCYVRALPDNDAKRQREALTAWVRSAEGTKAIRPVRLPLPYPIAPLADLQEESSCQSGTPLRQRPVAGAMLAKLKGTAVVCATSLAALFDSAKDTLETLADLQVAGVHLYTLDLGEVTRPEAYAALYAKLAPKARREVGQKEERKPRLVDAEGKRVPDETALQAIATMYELRGALSLDGIAAELLKRHGVVVSRQAIQKRLKAHPEVNSVEPHSPEDIARRIAEARGPIIVEHDRMKTTPELEAAMEEALKACPNLTPRLEVGPVVVRRKHAGGRPIDPETAKRAVERFDEWWNR